MEENLVERLHLNFSGGVQSWKERQEVVHLRQPCRKTLEGHALRFTHCSPYSAIFLESKLIDKKYSSKHS